MAYWENKWLTSSTSLLLNKDMCYLWNSIKCSHLGMCHHLLLKVVLLLIKMLASALTKQTWYYPALYIRKDVGLYVFFFFYQCFFSERERITSIDPNVSYECSPWTLWCESVRLLTTFSLTSGINRRGGWEQFFNTRETKIKLKGRSKYSLLPLSPEFLCFA